MHYSIRLSVLAFPASILLGFLLSLGATKEIEEDQVVEEKKIVAWMITQEQITSVSKSHLKTFKEIQNPSELSNASYQQLAGTLPIKKKLMTVGLSSMQHPQGNYLMSTLKSLFLASSEDELKDILVLVYLTVLDSTWFNETVTDIVKTFSPQTLAGQLLVICSVSTPSPPLRAPKTNLSKDYSNMAQFNQNVAHALLMNFAANLSNYFLMIEDNVHCLPNFITCMWREIVTWEIDDWVLMEFSTWGFVGKLLHSSVLPRLAQFFLLYKEAPPEVLLYHFRKLLDQNHPIQFSPSLFYQVGSFNRSSSNKPEYKMVKFKDREEAPNNPPATVYSNLRILNHVSPQTAYILGEGGFFWALEPKAGNHFTVVLAKAATVTRVQVLTGRDQENSEKLKDGKVELGYDPEGEPKACTHYILLGSLVNGKLDHKMLNKKTGKNVSCLKLVVSTSQRGRVMIRHINIWSKPEQ